MTPSPSELSIFDHNDEDIGEEMASRSRSRSSSSSTSGDLPEHQRPDDDDDASGNDAPDGAPDPPPALPQELLDALYLGTSNFLLAYNTRAGIGVLLRVFKLLQKRQFRALLDLTQLLDEKHLAQFRALLDLTQLLDEKHLAFRVDAVSLGLFLGWFTGGYRGLRALLPHVLRRLPRPMPAAASMPAPLSVEQLSSLLAGAGAACAIGFVDAKRRRSLALYALTRALQCGYNLAKRNDVWHFWGSDWEYGDALLFALSSAQVMYAFIMRPTSLPTAYFRFIQKTGPIEMEVLEMVRRGNRGLPVAAADVHAFLAKHRMPADFPLPTGVPDIVSCRLVHHHSETCARGVLQTFRKAFVSAFPLYLSLFIVPSVVIHFKKFLARPARTLGRAVLNATRSNTFVASFVALYMACVCVQRRFASKDHRIVYYLAGLGASTSILIEPKSRRSELALYVLPRALESLFVILRDRRIVKGLRHGDVALFSLSMACMMYAYEHEKSSMGTFLHSTLKRFLQTATDKKKVFLANLEQQQQRQQEKLRSEAQATANTVV
ncbi:hypothetical protein ATCC90586_003860 [Pythium insidiosum]|nr:hypothetical protein ATCC90586_003860 [Pythium insidiosum]